MKLASHLHKTLQEVKNGTTSTEFVMWQEYLEVESFSIEKNDYYLAQIAAEIRRYMSKNPKSIKLRDFILKFKRKKDSVEMNSLSLKERTKQSKRFWYSLVGIK